MRGGTGDARSLPHAALRDAVAGLATAASDARSWDAGDRRAVLADVDHAIARLTAVRSELLLAERDSGDWRGSGDPSFAAWRGRTARVGLRGGATDERRAETLTTMPDLRAATVAGSVSVAHVDVVGQTAARGSQAVRDALGSAEGQARVLELARRLDAGRFATPLARWAPGWTPTTSSGRTSISAPSGFSTWPRPRPARGCPGSSTAWRGTGCGWRSRR